MKPHDEFTWEILLVEDNPADVCLTQEALNETGVAHNLHVTEDGVDFFNRKRRYFQSLLAERQCLHHEIIRN